jgi:hypothetical protein
MAQSEPTPVAGFVANTRVLFGLVRTIVQFRISRQMVPEWVQFRDEDAAYGKLLEEQRQISILYQGPSKKGGTTAVSTAIRAKLSKAIERTQRAEEHLANAWITEKKGQLATHLAGLSASLPEFEQDLSGMALGLDRCYGHWRASSACKALEEVALRLSACLKRPGLEFQNTGIDWKKLQFDIDGECGRLRQIHARVAPDALVEQVESAAAAAAVKALKEEREAQKTASDNSAEQRSRAQVKADLINMHARSAWGKAMLMLARTRGDTLLTSAELIDAGIDAASNDNSRKRTVQETLRILRSSCRRQGGCAPCSEHLGLLDYPAGAKRGRMRLTDKGKHFVEALKSEARMTGTKAPKP